MNSYKFDTHVHTSEISRCGNVSAAELVKLYKEAGYYGVVITDHYNYDYFETLGNMSWEQQVDRFLEGYKSALLTGEKVGLKVFLGMEIKFNENYNEYLVFGIDERFLKEHRELFKLDLKQFRELIQDTDIMVYQAHPFRPGLKSVDPKLLDGVEVYNGNCRHNSKNHKALAMAEENNLLKLSGSDFHELEDLARGGIVLCEPAGSNEDFVRLLRENKVTDFICAD